MLVNFSIPSPRHAEVEMKHRPGLLYLWPATALHVCLFTVPSRYLTVAVLKLVWMLARNNRTLTTPKNHLSRESF